jgi:hypothetical protein
MVAHIEGDEDGIDDAAERLTSGQPLRACLRDPSLPSIITKYKCFY